MPERQMLYDVFICHAAEDKDSLVRPLAEILRKHRVEVWYDEFCLRPGDSLRRAIDRGLTSSRLGVVVLSPDFFSKSWPQWELDGLVQRELAAENPVVVPVWHRVTHEDVLAFSPSLADKVAIQSAKGPAAVARRLLEILTPGGSTLLIARDLVLDFGGRPPVVTHDWWLDVVEASSANPVEGTFQEASGWGRWGFPLPPRGTSPQQRGERLGWAAMQMTWMRAASERRISQVTRPELVLRFIEELPGLAVTCEACPEFLAVYAPQLVIPGLGGSFERVFAEALRRPRSGLGGSEGEAQAGGGERPRRYEWLALRDPEFDSLDAAQIACDFIVGYPVSFGPEARVYDTIDYVAWFLSVESSWLPRRHHRFLLRGLREWGTWEWWAHSRQDTEHPFPGVDGSGVLSDEMLHTFDKPGKPFHLSRNAKRDLTSRLEFSKSILGLPESSDLLAARFIRARFIQAWLSEARRRRPRPQAGPGSPKP